MNKSEQIKALKLVLDNPANNINETSRDLIQLVITNIELDMAEDAKTNVVSFVDNYIGEDKLEFSKRLAELGQSGQMVIIGGAGGIGKTSFAQRIAQDVEIYKKMSEEHNESNRVLIIDNIESGLFPDRKQMAEKMIEATMIPKEYFGEERIGAVDPSSRRYKSKFKR